MVSVMKIGSWNGGCGPEKRVARNLVLWRTYGDLRWRNDDSALRSQRLSFGDGSNSDGGASRGVAQSNVER